MNKTHVVIHHSATADSGTVSWNAIRRYHKSLGWRDIGYHLGIELITDGAGQSHYEALLGRPILDDGAHCYQWGMNKVGLGVVFVGDYDAAPPPEEMLLFAAPHVKSIMDVFNIPANRHYVLGHREFAPKTCPGKHFDLDKFARMLRG